MFTALYSELRTETMWQYGGLQMLCTANCHAKIFFFLSLLCIFCVKYAICVQTMTLDSIWSVAWLFWQVPDALILSLKRRIKHATFLRNWHITPWQHNTTINRNKLWNSYLVCGIRHCSPACLVYNFRCQWYLVINIQSFFIILAVKIENM